MKTINADMGATDGQSSSNITSITLENGTANIHDATIIKDGSFMREGADLHITHGEDNVVIEGYFNAPETPDIITNDGQTFDGNMIQSFVTVDPHYAAGNTMNDESPVGIIQELTGQATVTRTDGSTETMELGMPIHQGDIIETGADAALNIIFTDETHFAVSDNARLSIDEYVFDPDTNEGTTDFSVLKGLFVFTSGLIGREDPDDVNIDTPMGSIGIRGTIIAGNTNNGEITVVEGAIVLRDFGGNEVTLANQYETAQFNPSNGTIDMIGTLTSNDVGARFESVSDVAGSLFSSIQNNTFEETPATNQPADKPAPVETQHDKNQDSDEKSDATNIKDNTVTDKVKHTSDERIEKIKGNLDDRADAIIKNLNGEGNNSDAQAANAHHALGNLSKALQSLIGNGNGKSGHGIFNTDLSALASSQSNLFGRRGDNADSDVVLTDYAPEEFFASLDSTTWRYDFSLEFASKSDATLSYQLGANTDDTITALESNAYINTVSFNETTGVMEIGFGNISGFATEGFNFAVNSNDQNASPHRVSFDLFDKTFYSESSVFDDVFLNTTGPIYTSIGNSKTIHMGDGGRTVKLGNTIYNNEVIGGAGNDIVVIKGNDIATKLTGHDINFMHNPFVSAGQTTHGDILLLENTGTRESIDFTNINNIQNVETIDILGGEFTIDLSADNVFQMTDTDNVLIFKADSNDSINLNGGDAWESTGVSETIGADAYNEYQATANGETVSILVDADATVAGVVA